MIKFKSILLVLGLGLFSSALAQQNVQKEFHKELEVHADALIEIQNQFGDLKITSWDENKVVIDVLITVKGSNSGCERNTALPRLKNKRATAAHCIAERRCW